MNQSEKDELLIRTHQMVLNISKEIFEKPSYPTIKEKVLTHSKILWLTAAASITACVKAFWSV